MLIDGNDVTGRSGHVGYMLQKDLLLPWRTVIDNIVLGAIMKGGASHAQRAKALHWRAATGSAISSTTIPQRSPAACASAWP